jgi:fermentation-respiration switch protein FrsA (DUF1100 family)
VDRSGEPFFAGAGFALEHDGRLGRRRALEQREGLVRHWIEREGARTEAWLLRAATEAPSRGLVAITHGNAELIDHLLDDARQWRRMGFDVVLPEYRGYGRSTGSPSQDGIVGDTLAAIDCALAQTGRRALILHGRSLGTGVAMQVAGRLGEVASPHDLELAVLEAPFTSIASYAPRYGLPPFIVRDPYRTDEILPALACPVLILHTRDDEVVPIAHGRALASLAPARVTLVEFDGGHNSGISMTRQYWTAVEQAANQAVSIEEADRR